LFVNDFQKRKKKREPFLYRFACSLILASKIKDMGAFFCCVDIKLQCSGILVEDEPSHFQPTDDGPSLHSEGLSLCSEMHQGRHENREQDPDHVMANVEVILGDGETVTSFQSGFLYVVPNLIKHQSQEKI